MQVFKMYLESELHFAAFWVEPGRKGAGRKDDELR